MSKLTPEEAQAAILDGKTVKVTVGEGAEDPVLLVTLEEDCVMSSAIEGWSAGVVEPVCFLGSPYLARFLQDRAALELVEETR